MAYVLNASCLSSCFVSFRCIRISFLRNYFYRTFFSFGHISKEKHISRFRIKWILSFVGHHTVTYQHDRYFVWNISDKLRPITLSHFYLFVIVLHSKCASVMHLLLILCDTVVFVICFFFRVVKTGNCEKQMKTGQHPRQSPHLSFEYQHLIAQLIYNSR